MSATTVDFKDTRTEGHDPIGKVISRILEARKLAEQEREYAENQAEAQGTSLDEAGISKGFFFKKALKHKFGGNYLMSKKEDISNAQKKLSMLKNPRQNFWKFFEKSKKKTTQENFRSLFDYGEEEKTSRVKAKSDKIRPSTAERVREEIDPLSKQRVSREDILNAILKISESLEKTANSLAKQNQEVSENIIKSAQSQAMMIEQLKVNGSSLEDKLDRIAELLNQQSTTQKKVVQKAEFKSAEQKLESQKDVAKATVYEDLTTKESEVQEQNITDIAATSAQAVEHQQMNVYNNQPPEAETGGIISGPDSGYMAKLHGDEMIVPLDNNYTQGEPSAMDGKVRPKPSYIKNTTSNLNSSVNNNTTENKSRNFFGKNIQNFETGSTKLNMTSPVTSKVGFTPIAGLASGGTTQASSMAQSMVDVMSLPMMAAGGTLLASTTKYMERLGASGADLAPEIEKIARPIASVFGLPPAIVQRAKLPKVKAEKDSFSLSPKEVFLKLTEGFGSLLDKIKVSVGPGGSGGPSNTPPGDPNFSGSEASEKSMNFLISQGLSKEQAAGIAGNIMQESTFNPKADNTGTGESDTKGHFGIAQWDKVNRWPKVKAYIKSIGMDPYSLEGQLMGLKWEGEQRGDWAKIKETKTAEEAAASWLGNFERSGEEPGMHGYDARIKNAKDLAASFKPTAPSTTNKPSPKPSGGQGITQNFGMNVHDEFSFTHNGKVYKAHKTAVGFEFFDGATRVDTTGTKNKGIVDAFIRAKSGANITPPAQNQQQASLRPPSKQGGSTTVLNTGRSQQVATASTTNPSSGVGKVEPGSNPTKSFYNNSSSLAV